jgi:hypothetical protein
MRPRRTLAYGVIGGFALGVIARAWMRLISENPEFTWSGTIFIVAAFTIFGLAQSFVAVARGRVDRRSRLTIIRAIGAIAMLPLFVAAGALMMPTVVASGLAIVRTDWRPITRLFCLLIATVPVAFVGHDLIETFGWSLQTIAGVTLMSAIYATIIWATRFTFTAQPDVGRMSRRVRTGTLLVIAATASALFVAGGGFN